MNAPFYIGQKVVCIQESDVMPLLKKGNEYIIKYVMYCGLCPVDPWGVRVNDGVEIWIYNSTRFAPIQTNYADATAEILEKFPIVNDTPDKVIKEIPVETK